MRKALTIAFFLAATPIAPPVAEAANFTLYPGFKDPNAFVEMTTDKGLIIEIVLRCARKNGKVKAGIMTYSKMDRMFCSSKMRCTRDGDKAANETCGY